MSTKGILCAQQIIYCYAKEKGNLASLAMSPPPAKNQKISVILTKKISNFLEFQQNMWLSFFNITSQTTKK